MEISELNLSIRAYCWLTGRGGYRSIQQLTEMSAENFYKIFHCGKMAEEVFVDLTYALAFRGLRLKFSFEDVKWLKPTRPFN